MVRLGVAAEGAAYSLSGKFGVDQHQAPACCSRPVVRPRS